MRATSNPVKRVVVMVQENHTTDNYFGGLAPYGANVATGWPAAPNPGSTDPSHNRKAYYDWLTGAGTAAHTQFDTATELPYYMYLALTGAFLENHCSGFGTNSTANHLLIVGGQSPTLRNPSRRLPEPLWDMPSVPGLAEDHGVSWRVYAASNDYPVGFYTQLKGSPNVVPSGQFVPDAKAGPLPALVMLWHNSPQDEHPPADVTLAMNAIWQSVDAVVQGGGWDETVFLLTWDDWGGFDDHVATPVLEYTPDNVQLAYGPRVPLLMFGGPVQPGIDSRWCGHTSVPKTAIDLLGLPALGVARVDDAPSLADLIRRDGSLMAPPPAFGTNVPIPPAPSPTPAPHPLPPPPVTAPVPVPEIVLRGGGTLPPPNDQPLPKQPAPPSEPTPAAPRGHHPLRPHRGKKKPAGGAAATPAWPSYTGTSDLVGTSPRGVAIYVDPSLGAPALQNANDLLSSADHVVAQNNAIFGISGQPVSVILFALGGHTDGTGGADHMACNFVSGGAIEVDVAYGNPSRIDALFEAELSECCMNGRLCGVSTGEALSRWCAAAVSNNALSDFATAPSWVADGQANWVDRTDQTDQDPDATGCGVAFLSWLLSSGHTLDQVAQGMVALGDTGTLAALYARLSGANASQAWPQFETAIAGVSGGVRDDDPFAALPAVERWLAATVPAGA